MADVHSKAVRSFNLSRIKRNNTKPEILVRRFLFAKGFRYRIHVKDLPGRPDIVLPKYKTVILINGCFWHGHEGCKYFVIPKTKTQWWIDKINRNKELDRLNKEKLSASGWRTIVVYECELKGSKKEETLQSMLNELKRIL
jgi:DNA mismatch endonuclease (patch repair protein)